MSSLYPAVLAFVLLSFLGADLAAQTTPAKTTPVAAPAEQIYEVYEFSDAELPQYDEGKLQRLLQYPPIAREAGLEGTVTVQVVVDTSGHATRVEVVQSDAAIFNRPSIEAIRALNYRPGYQKGRPVPARMTIPIRFVLMNN